MISLITTAEKHWMLVASMLLAICGGISADSTQAEARPLGNPASVVYSQFFIECDWEVACLKTRDEQGEELYPQSLVTQMISDTSWEDVWNAKSEAIAGNNYSALRIIGSPLIGFLSSAIALLINECVEPTSKAGKFTKSAIAPTTFVASIATISTLSALYSRAQLAEKIASYRAGEVTRDSLKSYFAAFNRSYYATYGLIAAAIPAFAVTMQQSAVATENFSELKKKMRGYSRVKQN